MCRDSNFALIIYIVPFLQYGPQVNEVVPLVSGDASVVFSSTFLTIAAGASADVIVTFTAPTNLDASNVPIYSVSRSSPLSTLEFLELELIFLDHLPFLLLLPSSSSHLRASHPQGFIVVESADVSERYTIPYAGIAASLRTNYPIIDT